MVFRRFSYDNGFPKILSCITLQGCLCVGSAGRRFEVVSNLFKLNRKPTFHMYLHHVDFEPDVPNKGMRQGMIAEHTDTFGDIYEFDGMLLFLPKKLTEPVSFFCGL